MFKVLMRLVDFEGHIYLDGQDTKNVHLLNVRKNISVIPQVRKWFYIVNISNINKMYIKMIASYKRKGNKRYIDRELILYIFGRILFCLVGH